MSSRMRCFKYDHNVAVINKTMTLRFLNVGYGGLRFLVNKRHDRLKDNI